MSLIVPDRGRGSDKLANATRAHRARELAAKGASIDQVRGEREVAV
jgi:hypothetical protein